MDKKRLESILKIILDWILLRLGSDLDRKTKSRKAATNQNLCW